MANDPTQDKDFLAATPQEQHAYLMQTDPDYAKAKPGDQQAYLAHVRSQVAPPDAISQSRAQMAATVQPIAPTPFGLPPATPEQEKIIARARPQIPGVVSAIRRGALTAGGGAFGGGLSAAAKGLPWLIRTLAEASGIGAGAGIGNALGGGSLEESLSAAAGTTMAAAPGAGVAQTAPEMGNYFASKLRYPATARQAQLGRPGTVKDILPPFLQRYTVPPGLIPKGEVGTPTYPGTPENPGVALETMVRPPKAPPSIGPKVPFWKRPGFKGPSGGEPNVPTGPSYETPARPIRGNASPFPPSSAGTSGGAQKPFEPLVYSSEFEPAQLEQRAANLKRQASAAGTYHAAQGSARKATNLQQRIGKRYLPWEREE